MTPLTSQLLRSTHEAEEWIAQFDGGDRAAAALLIESLILISHSDFQNGMFELIRLARGASKRPIPLFAMRESDKEEPFDETKTPDYGHGDDVLHPWGAPERELADSSYFDLFDKSIRPDAVGRGAGIGSEGMIASLSRDITREDGDSVFQDHPSINSMAAVKSREVFLLDDIIGSGRRTCDFVDCFVGHKTIRSWHSRHHLSITIVAYAGSVRGIELVKSHRYVNKVVCARELVDGNRLWNVDESELAVALCKKYAYRSGRRKIPLGYGDAFTFLVFEHKCPNTAPPVFWSDSRKNNWRGLFRSRPGAGFSVWPVPNREDDRAKELLRRIGHTRLAGSNWHLHVQPEGRYRLLILAAISKRLRRPSILAEIVGLTQATVIQMLRECVDSGWLTPDHRITTMGLQELAVAREMGLSEREDVELRPGFYYPRSLRAAKDSI